MIERLFFALRPTADAARQISRTTQEMRSHLGLQGKPLAPDRLHITLHLLGDFPTLPDYLVERAGACAATFATLPACRAFDLSIDRAVTFRRRSGPSPTAALISHGGMDLMAFWAALGEMLFRAGLIAYRRAPSDFLPHVTLMYGDAAPGTQRFAPIAWHASELVLIHSQVGRTRHITLGRWAMSAPPELSAHAVH